jgi:exodeoxyribonuclease III
MKVISWNTNGLRATVKQGNFTPLFAFNNPDIVCFQETKCEPGQLDEKTRNLKGYHSYFSHPKSKKGYSGVAIYSKIKPISISFDIPKDIAKKFDGLKDKYGEANSEGRVIALEFERFFIVNVYTPNAKDDLSRIPLRYKMWDKAFLSYVEELNKKKPVIFMGDLNVAHTEDDLANPKQNIGNKGFTKEEREGIDNIIKAGFVDTFRIFTKGNGHYTWWSHFANARARNVGWRIDYIFVSKILEKKIKTAKILPEVLGSDHCPISIDIDL